MVVKRFTWPRSRLARLGMCLALTACMASCARLLGSSAYPVDGSSASLASSTGGTVASTNEASEFIAVAQYLSSDRVTGERVRALLLERGIQVTEVNSLGTTELVAPTRADEARRVLQAAVKREGLNVTVLAPPRPASSTSAGALVPELLHEGQPCRYPGTGLPLTRCADGLVCDFRNDPPVDAPGRCTRK